MKSFTYDKANQLATSTVDGKVISYAYDAAGRLIKEGSVASGFKTYQYGWLDKILEVQENGQQIAAFNYHIDGQIAQATHGDKSENFLWDGLALIHRGDNSYVNEPYVTGGNPILSSKDGVMFNDMLGTTLGVKNEKGFDAIGMTAFGEPTTSQPHNSTTEIGEANFFTGKPYIGELGYAFLFRNYRAEQGKWQTKDPLGYPDGWNNLAYVNNGVTDCIDWMGGTIYEISGGPNVDPTANGSTVANLNDWQYYIQSDIIFKTSRKDGYSANALTVTIDAYAVLYKKQHPFNWNTVYGSNRSASLSLSVSVTPQGISTTLSPGSISLVANLNEGYTQPFNASIGGVSWGEKQSDGWTYGSMILTLNYGTGTIQSSKKTAQVTYPVQSHSYIINVRKE